MDNGQWTIRTFKLFQLLKLFLKQEEREGKNGRGKKHEGKKQELFLI